MVVISLLVKTLSRLRDDSAARSSSSEKAHDESLLAIATIDSKEIGYDQAAYYNKASYYTGYIYSTLSYNNYSVIITFTSGSRNMQIIIVYLSYCISCKLLSLSL